LGFGFRVYFGVSVSGFGFGIEFLDFGFGVWGFGFRVSGFGFAKGCGCVFALSQSRGCPQGLVRSEPSFSLSRVFALAERERERERNQKER